MTIDLESKAGKGLGQGNVSIHINDAHFFVSSPISGAELRQIGGIPAENQLFQERPGPDPDVLIDPDSTYAVKAGTHFYDLPRGTVGADRDEQLAYAHQRLPRAKLETGGDGLPLLRWQTQLREPWTVGEAELVIVVPPAYPAQAPSGFDLVGAVDVAGMAPAGSGPRDLAGASCVHFCWSPAGRIDYTNFDGLWRFAKFSETRFQNDA
jgi:hypothetical protein